MDAMVKDVLERRYLLKDSNGTVIETEDGMYRRVATAVAAAETDTEKWEEMFFQLMASKKFLPNSPTLFNAGKDTQMCAACFVLPIADTMESILKANSDAVRIQKLGGGVGFSFSNIRQAGARVNATDGVASGPVSFMNAIYGFVDVVEQGGMRRGANMGILSVHHPDIEKFIACKSVEGKLSAFNISVAVTDVFMSALCAGTEYDLRDPATGKGCKNIEAKYIWNLICEQAHKTGDPGVVFIDAMNCNDPVPDGILMGPNACSEATLKPYESCFLGSINLTAFVKDDLFDYEALEKTAAICTRFLDDVITVNDYPIPEIAEVTPLSRKIGLGVMGFADVLYALRIPYNSVAATSLAETIMEDVAEATRLASHTLGEERGSFPDIKQSIYDIGSEVIPTVPEQTVGVINMRNAMRNCIAPTGTISMIAECSSGIEPQHALAYNRTVDGKNYDVFPSKAFNDTAHDNNYWGAADNSEDFATLIKSHNGSIQDIDGIPQDVKDVFVVAHDISWEGHVRMQAAFQKHIDMSVSKTVNLPNAATITDVSNAYKLAYELGCKGVTVFRDGCRDNQVINFGTAKKKEDALVPRERPRQTTGTVTKVKTGCGNFYITVANDDHGLCEVFTNLGRGGGCKAQSEATGRLVSLAARAGVDTKAIIKQLRGIRCDACTRVGAEVLSCPDAIGRVIQATVEDSEVGLKPVEKKKDPAYVMCPDCGSSLVRAGGCVECKNCGWSKCN